MTTDANVSALPSSAALAYLGDAVFSLYVREKLVERGFSHAKELNEYSRRFVSAQGQAEFFLKIEDMLTEEERDICRRASNSSHLQRPKHTPISVYRRATGLEALIGALHFVKDVARLDFLLSQLDFEELNDDTHTAVKVQTTRGL